MHRRDYLSLFATGAAGVTGYTTAQQTTTSENDTAKTATKADTSQCSTDTPTTHSTSETTEATKSGTGGLKITSTSYKEVSDDIGLTTAGVWVNVTNASDSHYSFVEVSAAFRDGQDTIITEGLGSLIAFPPGETWRTFLSHASPKQVESATVEITDSTRGTALPTAKKLGLSVQNARLVQSGQSGPTVVGEVTNKTGGPLSYLEAVVRFRGKQFIHGSNFTNVSNFAAGDTWRFELQFTSLAPTPPKITDYDLRFTT